MNENEMISLNTFTKKYCGKNKKVHWIRSYPTAKKWIIDDLTHNNVLQVSVIDRIGTAKRYYIPVKNIDNYVKAFESNTLYVKEN